MTVQTIDLILVGLGNVHQRLLHLLDSRRDLLAARYGLRIRVVGAADSRGAVADAAGIDPAGLLAHKQTGGSAGTMPGGVLGASALDLLSQVHADVLLEASPVNLVNAEPAVSTVLAALERGIDVVLANKAPLALYYPRLRAAAAARGARLAFSATVCGGLPVVNVGTRDLVAARVQRVQGVFNSTSNYILSQMAAGQAYADALTEAQRRGIAETNPAPGRGGVGHRQQANHRGQRGAGLRLHRTRRAAGGGHRRRSRPRDAGPAGAAGGAGGAAGGRRLRPERAAGRLARAAQAGAGGWLADGRAVRERPVRVDFHQHRRARPYGHCSGYAARRCESVSNCVR
jgi:hypothetical protein